MKTLFLPELQVFPFGSTSSRKLFIAALRGVPGSDGSLSLSDIVGMECSRVDCKVCNRCCASSSMYHVLLGCLLFCGGCGNYLYEMYISVHDDTQTHKSLSILLGLLNTYGPSEKVSFSVTKAFRNFLYMMTHLSLSILMALLNKYVVVQTYR